VAPPSLRRHAAIRAGGCAGVHEVRIAVLENSGDVTIIAKNGPEKPTVAAQS